MIYVYVSVEGQTEETFINKVLNPYLLTYEVYTTPILLKTKKVLSGPDFRGGLTNYEQAKRDIQNLLKDHSVQAVTTFYDFYGLPNDFPGKDSISIGNCYERVTYLEGRFKEDINNPKFFPYLQLHEFEAFLFVNPEPLRKFFNDDQKINRVYEIKRKFNTPEEINDSTETAPSKRIRSLFPGYQKPLHGPQAISEVGIENLMHECSHFRSWVEWLLGLGT